MGPSPKDTRLSLSVQVSYSELHYGYGDLNGFQDSKTIGAWPFLALGKLGGVPLGDATHQI